MRMVVDASGHGAGHVLINISTRVLAREIIDLLSEKKNADAILLALSRGCLERAIRDGELGRVKADLIVSARGVRWDVLRSDIR